MISFIETFTGHRFRPLDPDVADITIGDIAHALSHQCRFSGHTRIHYSVAEHCVRVSELLEKWGHPKPVQKWGLLHDASEAYLVDLPTPLKKHASFKPYRVAEKRLMRKICERFDLDPKQPPAVREADLVLLRTEMRDLMPGRPEHWAELIDKVLPMQEEIIPWCHESAERNFLSRYVELGL